MSAPLNATAGHRLGAIRAAGWCAVVVVALACAGAARAQLATDASVEYFGWREHTSPIEVKETGPRFGFGVGFVQPRERGLLFAYHGRVYGGSVHYSGSFQFDETRAASGTSVYLGTTQGVELRYRWPAAVDALAGFDFDVWRRSLSATQKEVYRIGSARFGVERPATDSSPLSAGAGMRCLVATSESATVEDAGFRYDLSLTPGLGASPFAHAGYRVAPRVTLLAYWDGMRLGRSNRVVLIRRRRPVATVSQPSSAVNTFGLGVSYRW